MRTLAATCIERPVFAAMIVLALVVVGAASFFRLGVDRFPTVDLPTVMVRTDLPGASVEEIETQVSEVLEEAINQVEGITELRSISGPGQSLVLVTFDLTRDIDTAAQDVRDRVAKVVRRLPDDIEPPLVQKFDSDSRRHVLTLALSGDRPIRELTEIADKTGEASCSNAATGVGEVAIVGGLERADQRLGRRRPARRLRLPITAVRAPSRGRTRRARAATSRPIARSARCARWGAFTIPRVRRPGDRAATACQSACATSATPRTARKSSARWRASNGVPTVVLETCGASPAPTRSRSSRRHQGEPRRLQAQLPSDVRLEIVRDQSRYIHAALHEINVHLVLGSILACLVVLAFMRSWRATFIAGVAIPVSVIATFGMMWALGFTLNSVTMLALVLMVGIVIDDAIVVLENIFRFVEEKQMLCLRGGRRRRRRRSGWR
jgi:HAE1 family hydrophobic/amphiphilic exporter-1